MLRARIEEAAGGLAASSYRRPYAAVGAWLLVLLALIPGMQRLSVDTSTDSVLDKTSAAWADYLASKDVFGEDEAIVVALPVLGDELAEHDLKRMADITGRMQVLSSLRRVDSLATVPLIRSDHGSAVAVDPAVGPSGEARVSMAKLRELLRNDRIAPDLLVSKRLDYVAINGLVNDSSEGYGELVSEIRMIAPSAMVSGVPVFRSDANVRTVAELSKFVPLTCALLSLVILWGFRSLRALAVAALVSFSGASVLVGAMGYAGVPFTLTTAILPTVVLGLGSAFAMHLLSAASAIGDTKAHITKVAGPIALSGVTTGMGLFSTCLIQIEAIQFVGAFGSLAVLAAMLACLTLAPGVLALLPLGATSAETANSIRRTLSARIAGFSMSRPRLTICAWVVVAVVAALGAAQVKVDTDVTRWFRAGTPTRDAYVAIRDALSGITQVNFVVEAAGSESMTSETQFAQLRSFQGFLAEQEIVGKVLTFADPVSALLQALEQGGQVSRDQAAVEQALLLLDSMESLGDLISGDYRQANMALRLNDNGSDAILDLVQLAREEWASRYSTSFDLTATGVMYQFAIAADRIAWGQVRGLLVAACVVGLLLWRYYKSLSTGLLAMIPNVLPILVAFGCLGFLGIPIDAGTVLIGNLAIGIAVDDTVHLLDAYNDRRVLPFDQRIFEAIDHVLPALLLTTLAVGIGLAVLGLSGFSFVRTLGLVTAGVMVVCLATDLTLLPALLRLRDRS
ncbi:MAG: efflux RND transporter permease subunit [Acidimicrobiia bacterium]